MTTALETRGQPPPAAAPLRIRLTAEVARQLGRYVSAIAAKLRTELDNRRGTGDLVFDLSQAGEVPPAHLLLLIDLSRRIIGHGPTITLSGVRPMALGPLTAFDLPDDVVVVDARGRQWATT